MESWFNKRLLKEAKSLSSYSWHKIISSVPIEKNAPVQTSFNLSAIVFIKDTDSVLSVYSFVLQEKDICWTQAKNSWRNLDWVHTYKYMLAAALLRHSMVPASAATFIPRL